MPDKIKIYVKEPDKDPEARTIPNTLEALQEIVGGYIETFRVSTDLTIICNEEGRLLGLPYNFTILGRVSFVGTVVFAGVNGDEFCDVPSEWVPSITGRWE